MSSHSSISPRPTACSPLPVQGGIMLAHALFLTAPRTLAWLPQHLPPPGPTEVLVQTTSGAVSIGSKLPHYRGESRIPLPQPYPPMTGYESVGRVFTHGGAIEQLQIGQRVLSFYGHRTHTLVPAARAIPIPDDIDDALALLAILSCDVEKGLRRWPPAPPAPALTPAAAPTALLPAGPPPPRAPRGVDIAEPLPDRRSIAKRLGARHVSNP